MNEELLINVTPMETRVALVENGMLQEVYIERKRSCGIVGNIYKGKVVRVLPGMQAAFVDIGLERAAFIHAGDLYQQSQSSDEVKSEPPSITSLVREGQSLVVQVTKDPISTKGARLTTRLSIPSRFLVYLPQHKHLGVSQRIDDEAERERLKQMVTEAVKNEGLENSGGFILRTAAEGVGEFEIQADTHYLRRLWNVIQKRVAGDTVPALVYEELPLHQRAIRDLIRAEVDRVRIDSKETFQKIHDFCKAFVPNVLEKIEYYPGERPIFDLYSVEDEIQKALDRKVQLKSGGYLIIDQTEAMTTIDINTGAFVGHRNLEETIFKTNLEAAIAIGRQLRLRNLGGIIIVDFIDMLDPEHQRQVLRMVEKTLDRDHAKNNISGVSELGLVEITRKRTRESLEQLLCEPCHVCSGRGSVKTAETICYEIFREILREARTYDRDSYLILASQQVVDRMLDEDSDNVAELEMFINKTIKFQVEPTYHQEQYDVILQ